MPTALQGGDAANCYRASAPFPHIVIDDHFDSTELRQIAAEVRAAGSEPDSRFYGQTGKRTVSRREEMGLATLALIDELNGPDFIAWLESLTGISGLVADPDLVGGGVHRIGRGGFLKIHTDFNWHRGLQMHRRVNLLLYLNEGWRDQWGGALELWHPDMSGCAERIAPLFNRMVIFSTTDDSYHGHPEPLACPDAVTRNSIALYYYSPEPAPGQRFGSSELTNYRPREGERFGAKHRLHQAMLHNPALRRVLGR